jgi:hypothetical protein
MDTETTTQTDPATGGEPGQTIAQTGTVTGGQTEARNTGSDKTFTQADLDALAAKVRGEEKDKLRREQERIQQESEAKRLQEQGEFQKLYDTEKQRADTTAGQLEEVTKERDSFRDALANVVKAQAKALPKEVAGLLPDGSPVEQMAWLLKAQEALPALKPGLPPSGERNPGSGNGSTAPTKEQTEAATRRYSGQW